VSATEADPRSSDRHQHECEGRREGGWVVYTCPKCDYELRKNPASGELIVRNLKPSVRHYGSMPWAPPASKHQLN
jgi:hypothetical protein